MNLLPYEERMRGRIIAFARETLSEVDFAAMLEEIAGERAEQVKNVPSHTRSELPSDWMKSGKVFPTDYPFGRLLQGALFADLRALDFIESGNPEVAIEWLLMAATFFGQAERAYRSTKISAKKAGEANGDRWESLRTYAVKEAVVRNFQSRSNAAKTLLPEIRAMGKILGLALTIDDANAAVTISGWLKEGGFNPKSKKKSIQ